MRCGEDLLTLWFPGSAWETISSGLCPEKQLISMGKEAEPPDMHSEAEPRNERHSGNVRDENYYVPKTAMGSQSKFLPGNEQPQPAIPHYGTIANTRAGNPDPLLGLGKATTTIAPYSGTLSRLVRSSIWYRS